MEIYKFIIIQGEGKHWLYDDFGQEPIPPKKIKVE